MATDVFERALLLMDRLSFSVIKVNGGEPTIAPRFAEFSRSLRERFPRRPMILGTHGGHLGRDSLRDVLALYDELYVSTDDVHGNLAAMEGIVDRAMRRDQRVTFQVVEECISAERLRWLEELCTATGARLSLNRLVVHEGASMERCSTMQPSASCFSREIVIMPNGDIHRCCKKDLNGIPDTTLFNDNARDEIISAAPVVYAYCQRCEFYRPSSCV